MTPDQVIAKVRKLLALGTNDGATDGERANAMRMAHKLLAKYNLDMSDVSDAEKEQVDERGSHAARFYGRPWAQMVCISVAKLMFCRYLLQPGRRADDTIHHFIGRRTNAISAALLAEYVVKSIRKESGKRAREMFQGNAWRRTFATGAAVAVHARVKDMLDAAQPAPEPGKALVLADVYRTEDAANAEWIEGNVQTGKSVGRAKDLQSGTAFARGRDYGSTIPLNRQVAGGADAPLSIGHEK